MKIRLEGIHLKAETIEDLHKFAAKISVSRSWFHPTPEPHYDIIHPLKLRAIRAYIKRGRRDN